MKDLALAIDADAAVPLFLRIAHAFIGDIRRGRLRPGVRLPGSRSLAASLDVHRNTVVAAYAELSTQGWVKTRVGGGTFVSDELPEVRPRRFSRRVQEAAGLAPRPAFDLLPAPRLPDERALPPGTLAMWGGVPDLRLVPRAVIARVYRRALSRAGTRLLAYGDRRGHPALRAAIASWIATTRGIAASEDTVLVTRGSQMAIDLAARVLVAPGDAVVVEDPGYVPAWAAFRRAGAELVGVRVDRHGIDTRDLARVLDARRVRAIYVTPHHHYPTTVVMSPARRLELLDLATRHRVAIIEDDYDHEFHYEGRPVLPLASADRAGVVIYVGTLSKILAPGLRLGFAIAPEPLIARLADERFISDRQGDRVLEAAVAELMEDGELSSHVRRMRNVYRARRDALLSLLEQRFGEQLRCRAPAGGMALWVHAPGIDVAAWQKRALEHRVAFAAAHDYSFHRARRPYLRLGFASLDERELEKATKRMREALP